MLNGRHNSNVALIDSNILLYAYDNSEPVKQEIAITLIEELALDLLQESSEMNFSAGGVPPCRASHSQGKRISSVGRLFLSRVRSCTRLTQEVY